MPHSPDPAGNSPKSDLNPEAAPFTTPVTTACFSASTNKTVLSQTARTVAYNPGAPQFNMEVRVILDPGSQRSYITNQVKDAIALTPAGK